jgi:hypothetical protein
MNNAHFVVLFNIIDRGYQAWVFPILACIFLALGCSLPVLIKKGFLLRINVIAVCLLAFGLVIALLDSYFTSRNYLAYRDALNSGRTSFVEGTVTDLETLDKQESFSVYGVRFSYSDYGITEGFNNMSSHGGPIRQGLYVRIWYIDDVILKLEAKG